MQADERTTIATEGGRIQGSSEIQCAHAACTPFPGDSDFRVCCHRRIREQSRAHCTTTASAHTQELRPERRDKESPERLQNRCSGPVWVPSTMTLAQTRGV